MRLAALLARKDLVQTARDRLSFVFILVMPLAFTLFFGILFGANSSTQKLPVAVWDADGGAAAKQLVADLGKSAVVRTVAVNGADLEQQIADDKAAAGLVIPAGYSQAVADGKQAQLTIVSTQGSSGAATVASEIRSLAGEQVTVELAARCRGGRSGRQDRHPAGAEVAGPRRCAGAAGVAADARHAGREHEGRRGRRGRQPDPERLRPQLAGHDGELHPLQPHDRRHRAHRRAPERHAAAPHDHAAPPLGAHRRQGGRHVLPDLRAADPAARRRTAVLRRGLPAGPGRVAADDGVALARGEHAGPAARLGDEERAGAHRDDGARLDGRRRACPARGSRWRSPGRRSRPSATCCRPPGSSTGCAASWCAGSTSPTCCPRSVSRSRGPRGSSCSPSGASASAMIARQSSSGRRGRAAQPFFGLMLASLGSASPASTSIALMMPLGTGQAGWTRCSAASLRVTGPSPR